MKDLMLLKKICSVYASDIHFATLIFPFIKKELEKNTEIITMLEKDEIEQIEKILKNIGIDIRTKEKFKKIDWKKTNIKKVKKNFEILENNIKEGKNTDIIVLGEKTFIKKINEAIDIWVKNNIENIEKTKIQLNVINCFSFYENRESYNTFNTYSYILKTSGLEEIIEPRMLKAN